MVKKKVKHSSVRQKIRQEVVHELQRDAEVKQVNKKLCRFEELTRVIIFLAILGVLISIYMTWLHYSPAGASFCSINEKFDCNAVNKSGYSVFVIPVAMIGILGYLSFIGIGVLMLRGTKITQKHLHWVSVGFALIGWGFSVYLTYAQAVFIGKWCVMCIASFIVITLILLSALLSYWYCVRCKHRLEELRAEMDNRCRYY